MARARYRESIFAQPTGLTTLALLSAATVALYQPGTSTPITDTIYAADTGAGVLVNPLTSDALGVVEFWLERPQRVDLYATKLGYTAQRITVDLVPVASENPVRNVMEHGATGDGVTDDTAAIQAAISAGIGRVVFPKGIYRTTATITVPSATWLEGEAANGPGVPATPTQAFIRHDFSGTCFDFIGSAVSDTVGSGSGMRNLTILQNDGAGAGASGVCIRVHSVSNTQRSNWFRLENVHVEEVTGKNGWTYCLSIDGVSNSDLLRDVFISGCRFVAGALATAAVRIAGVANAFITDCMANGANSNLLITGDGTHLSSSILVANSSFNVVALDFAQTVNWSGGSAGSVTMTANTLDCVLFFGALTTAPTLAGTRNTVAGRMNSTGKWSIFTNNTMRFDIGANDLEITGPIRQNNAVGLKFRNQGNTTDLDLIKSDTNDDVVIGNAGNDIKWIPPMIAMGGGAAPTLGTIGATGPAAAGQNSWLRVIDSAGNAHWLPTWR